MELKLMLQRIVFCVLLILPNWVNGQYEAKTVKEIGRKIYDAIGMTSKEMPEIVINEHEETHVASFPPGRRNLINFELKAYRICQSLGPDSLNAIAFILSHELGHWYKEPYFLDEASTAYAGTSAIGEINKAKENVHGSIAHETEADEFACFYSKMAGFSLKSVDTYIRAIYKGYNLPDSLPRYPSLDSRCEIAERASERMDSLNTIFNIANVLLLQSKYESASVLFKYILNNKFGSREIKNNLGICYAMMGLRLSNASWKNLVFPFMLDPLSRAGESYRALTQEDSSQMIDWYKRAEIYFSDAAALDKNYYLAKINGAILNALLSKPKSAKRILEDLEETFSTDSQVMMDIRYGRALIDYIAEGKTSGFTELAASGHKNAKENLARIMNPADAEQKNCLFPSSLLADSLHKFIGRRYYNSNQQERLRTDDETVNVYIRDTLNLQLILLSFKNTGETQQILGGKFQFLWPDGIPREYFATGPDLSVRFGSGEIERRCASGTSPMTFYTLKREGEEVKTFVVY